MNSLLYVVNHEAHLPDCGLISLGEIQIKKGKNISIEDNKMCLSGKASYAIDANIEIKAQARGRITVSLCKNGEPIRKATRCADVLDPEGVISFHVPIIINVIDKAAYLTVMVHSDSSVVIKSEIMVVQA